MASFTAEIEFDVTCDTCGDSLDYEEKENRGNYELKVQVCTTCMKEKDDEIKDIGAEGVTQIEELQSEIEELQDKIAALEVELTYNVLKNNEVMTMCH